MCGQGGCRSLEARRVSLATYTVLSRMRVEVAQIHLEMDLCQGGSIGEHLGN